jgi:hypothetical protein
MIPLPSVGLSGDVVEAVESFSAVESEETWTESLVVSEVDAPAGFSEVDGDVGTSPEHAASASSRERASVSRRMCASGRAAASG